MTRRRKIIIIVILVLLALAIALFLLFGRAPAPAAAPVVTPTPAPAATGLQSPPAKLPPPSTQSLVGLPPTAAPQQPDVVHVAEIFAQRYASYSNQEAPYQNLEDLMPIMTDAYRAKVSAMVASASQAPATSYQGVTSVKVTSRVLSNNGTKAVAEVSLQQTATNAKGSTVTYRTLRLSLVKSGDTWQVDSVMWVP